MEDYECGESESDNQHEEYSQPPKKTKYEIIDEQLALMLNAMIFHRVRVRVQLS